MTDRHDRRMRELTYKLIQMAPEAPPFPEVPVTTLAPKTRPGGTRPPHRPVAAWVAAAAFGLVLLIGLPLLLLRGGDEPVTDTSTVPPSTTAPVSTTQPPTTTIPVVTQPVTLYFLADYVEGSPVAGPHLVPVQRMLPVTPGIDEVGVALQALIEGPSPDEARVVPGISSSVPTGTTLLGWSTGAGLATVDLSVEFESGGGSFAMITRLAQVTYTVTQFPGIDRVEFQIDGAPVEVFSSEGIVLDRPQTRDDYRDLLPLIFVETPTAGAEVSSPIEVAGVANTFEAGVEYRLETGDGAVLADGFTTATCGTGCWGDFAFTVDYTLATPAEGTLVVFETSARDGSEVNVVRIPLTLGPSDGGQEAFELETYGLLASGIPFGASLEDAVVVESPIIVAGFTNAPAVEVDGASVAVMGGSFEATVDLEPGVNEIAVHAGATTLVHTITYLPDGEVQFGFVTGLDAGELVVDYAQWLIGDDANRAAEEDGVIAPGEGVPNDYYIRNQNDQLRTLALAPDARIYVVDTTTIQPLRIDRDTWLGFVAEGGTFDYFGAGAPETPHWFVLDGAGRIVQVAQQYIP